MARMIFVNLPVADVAKATAFYEAIGATKNPMFSDENAACIVFSDTIHAMLLSHARFRDFTPKPIADARATTEVLICISEESRAGVDAVVDKAIAAGGREPREGQDHGFMRSRAFEDLDGHIWEVMWMDPAAVAGGPQAAA